MLLSRDGLCGIAVEGLSQDIEEDAPKEAIEIADGTFYYGERPTFAKASRIEVTQFKYSVARNTIPMRFSDAKKTLEKFSIAEAGFVATHGAATKILYFAATDASDQPSQLPLLLEKRPDLGMAANDDGIELRMRGEARKQLWIAADTRESDVAVYLDSWRRKIERVGTMNFPDAARREKLSGTPVIEVTIGADGRLLQTVIRRSSGHAEIDEAAMRILKLAAPYDPFPRELAAAHDEIRIAYEWQFLGGAAQGSGVFYSDPNDSGGRP